MLRQLHAAVTRLAQTEQVRRDAASHIALAKRAKGGLGALGRWAAGGAVTAKSPEEELVESREKGVAMHREGVVWYLQRQLERAGALQGGMMEVRIAREVERSKSVLYKSRVGNVPYEREPESIAAAGGGDRGNTGEGSAEMELSQEQLQLFAQENQDMLKHYEDTLDQVRYVVEAGLLVEPCC